MPRVGIEGGSHSWAEFRFSALRGESRRELWKTRGVFLSANSKFNSYCRAMDLRASETLLEQVVEGLSTIMSPEDARILKNALAGRKIGQSWNLTPKEDEPGRYEVKKKRTSPKLNP